MALPTGNSPLEWALFYASEGIKVFPIKGGTMLPRIEGWTEYATDEEDIIVEWWTRYPADNIGGLTGAASGIVVLDIDNKKGRDGSATVREWEEFHGEPLSAGPTCCTPSGGFHHYFRYEEGLSSCIALGDGVDLSSDQRCVLLPPSKRGENSYSWLDDDSALGSAPLPVAPRWLVHLRRHVEETVRGQGTFDHIDLGANQWEGTRNQACFKLAAKLRGSGKEFDEIYEAVSNYNLEKCLPPLADKEVETAVGSACRYEPNPSRIEAPMDEEQCVVTGLGEETPSEWSLPNPPGAVLTEPLRSDRFKWVTEIDDRDYPPIEWLIPGILAPGVTFLSGHSKIGKSWFCLQACRALGSGGEMLDRQTKECKVLYLALEDPERRVKKRYQQQQWSRQSMSNVAIMDSKTFYLKVRTLSTRKMQQQLLSWIKEDDFKVVIIDTFSRAFPDVKQNEVESVTNALAYLQEAANELDFAVILVDHQRKSASDDSDHVNDVGGSRAKVGVSDCTISIVRKRGEDQGKIKVSGREGPDITIDVRLDSKGLWIPLSKRETLKGEDSMIVSAIRGLGEDATNSAIWKAYNELVEAENERLGEERYKRDDGGNWSRTLDRLKERGVVERKSPKGKNIYVVTAGYL